MSFWEKTVNQPQKTNGQNHSTDTLKYSQFNPQTMVLDEQTMVLDEQTMKALQEDPNIDIFEEEDQDIASIMSDANLRLEQGRLYQMVMQGDIFADTNADPKAIRNVQREIRKFVRERMETMLGIRQELPAQEAVVSSPFNDMEVVVLKMLASKMSKGATEETQAPGPSAPPAQPKKDGITSISGSLRPQTAPVSVGKPLSKTGKPVQDHRPKVNNPAKSAINKTEEESMLQKPIGEMTQEELADHDAKALERRSKNYATMPNNMTPHPDPAALEMMYTIQATQMSAPGSAVANVMALMNNRK